jgi:hypothetical protein
VGQTELFRHLPQPLENREKHRDACSFVAKYCDRQEEKQPFGYLGLFNYVRRIARLLYYIGYISSSCFPFLLLFHPFYPIFVFLNLNFLSIIMEQYGTFTDEV